MLTMRETTILGGQPLGMCSSLVWEQFLGVARDNQQYHLSIIEAKYRASAGAAQESTWLKLLMEDLHQKIEYPISLHCDNQSAIRLAENC